MTKKYSATKISQFLDISVRTLNSWYAWYNDPQFTKPNNVPKLPPYEQERPRAPRYWDENYLYDLKKFKEWIPKGRGGVMGEYNCRNWGSRGKKRGQNDNRRSKTDSKNNEKSLS